MQPVACPDPASNPHSSFSHVRALAVLPFLVLALVSPRARAEAEPGAFSSQAVIEPAVGLIAHWPLNEGDGPLAADPVGVYTATLANGAAWTTGRLGAGVQLDGIQGYISPPVIDVPGSALTLAAWVKVASYGSEADQRFISKATGTSRQQHYWMLGHVRSGRRNRLRFLLKAGGTTTTLIASRGELPTNTWFHAAATYDGATMRVFLNGVEVGRSTKTGAIATSPVVPVDIGRNPDGSNHLRGVIDEIRIYERALAGEEIPAVMEDPGEAGPDTVAPSTPANLQGSAVSSSAIALRWSASTDDRAVAGYRVKRNGMSVATAAGTTYTDAGLAPSTTYVYSVSAFDDVGNESAESATVSVTTSPNQPPAVRLSAPASGATFVAPATVTIAASASDPENRLADVRFYAGATLLATDATAPYSYTWSGVAAGSYSITAVARDADGATATSPAVAVTVQAPPNQPPAVTLSSPASGATFVAPATVTITASASDPENRLADVRFYAGTTLLATDTTAPYSFTWLSVPAGSYSLTAVARDSDGATATSGVVAITVTGTVVTPWRVAFTASIDHDTLVTGYLVDVFPSGADPNTAIPLATSDLGKPVPDANREIIVDRTSFFEALATGNYVMTVSAIGSGGRGRSAPFAFSR